MKNNIFSFLIGIFLGSILFVPIVATRLDATETKVKTGNEALQSYYEKHKNYNENMNEISSQLFEYNILPTSLKHRIISGSAQAHLEQLKKKK